jgi:hypothetical protein
MNGGDFGLVGPSYQAPMVLQNAENCINFYVEMDEGTTPKEALALLATPGLTPILNTQTGECRGFWALPGNQNALMVVANACFYIQTIAPATSTAIAQFSATNVGTLLTSSGPVVIRDNGVVFGGKGGYAVIVDGTYGYYFRIAGASTLVFTAGVVNTTPTVTPAGGLPIGILIGTGCTLTDTSGFIPGGTTISSINYTAQTFDMSANATGTNAADTLTLQLPQFGRITDPGFLGADHVAFIEGWLIFNQPGTRTFYTTGTTPYTLTFPGTFFALKDSSTDNLISLYELNRELWLIGERTSEVWFNAGGANFAFSRVPGVGPQIGCAAKYSVARYENSLIWFCRNEQGENTACITQQYATTAVSNHAVEHAWASYAQTSDAIGYVYQEEGHAFWVLTFPTANATWVLDIEQGMWHRRTSSDPATGTQNRHRSNCYANLQDLRLVGDYQTGQVHLMTRSVYTDAGATIRRQRRAPHVWSRENRERVFQSSLQVEFTPGVGVQVGQGSNPQAMLRWSNDGGFTWSSEHWASIGLAGATKNRAKWNRLGYARDRVYEVNFSDPVPCDVIGATLFGEGEA